MTRLAGDWVKVKAWKWGCSCGPNFIICNNVYLHNSCDAVMSRGDEPHSSLGHYFTPKELDVAFLLLDQGSSGEIDKAEFLKFWQTSWTNHKPKD